MAITWTSRGGTYKNYGIIQEEYAALITGAVATGDGEWFSTRGLVGLQILVDGITTGTVTIYGSNAATIPANSSHGVAMDALTADGEVAYDRHQMPMWMKARVSAWTTGTFNVNAKRLRQSS